MSIPDYVHRVRDKVGHDLLHLPSVTVIAFDDQGRILLVKHADTQAWVAPGGSVDPDESPADAAVREMWEETGLLVEPTCVLGVYGGPECHVTYPNGDEVSYLMTVFEGRVVGGELGPNDAETSDLGYFSQAELATLDLPPWMPIVLADAFEEHGGTRFRGPTWKPRPDEAPQGGLSDYMRRLRGKVGSDLLLMPAVGGVVLDEQGRVLMQKRADNGQWNPPGGAIEPHEAPADAVVREVWEETGVLVEPVRLAGIYNGPEFHVTFINGDRSAVFSLIFGCRVIGGQPRPDGIETLEVQYFTPEEFAGDFLPRRWHRRLADVVRASAWAHFDPVMWKPPSPWAKTS